MQCCGCFGRHVRKVASNMRETTEKRQCESCGYIWHGDKRGVFSQIDPLLMHERVSKSSLSFATQLVFSSTVYGSGAWQLVGLGYGDAWRTCGRNFRKHQAFVRCAAPSEERRSYREEATVLGSPFATTKRC